MLAVGMRSNAWGRRMGYLVKIAPFITATIAFIAVGIAIYSVHTQRAIARKRAAIDIFFKTEMDEKMLLAWDRLDWAIKLLKSHKVSVEDFASTEEYRHIRAYLNIHELIAVGVLNGVFDDDVCYEYWSQALADVCSDTREVITYARSLPDCQDTYRDLVRLNEKWMKRAALKPSPCSKIGFRFPVYLR